MRVVFMGTPQLAASVLARLDDNHDVVGVYTRPDAVRGRGKKLVASPVKQTALDRGLTVFTPTNLREESFLEGLRALEPDVVCVAAYGAILPREVLCIPKYGCLNVHTSLLPRWRGAAPMERAILAQDEKTGVCIMRLEESLDTGPYCRRIEVEMGEKYLADLVEELGSLGADALVDALASLETGEITWTEQLRDRVTYASKIGKGEFDLDVADNVDTICAKVRASSPAHPARAIVAGRGMTVERVRAADSEIVERLCGDVEPGDVVFREKKLLIGARGGVVELQAMRPDGKKSMDARSFAAGIQGIKNNKFSWERA